MNIYPLIISALSPLGLDVEPNVYSGTNTEYIRFNYTDERPVVSADDEDILDQTSVQVHYFTRGYAQANKKEIRKLLKAAGFTIQSTQEIYETDTDYTHVIIYACIEGIIDDN